MGRVLTYFDRVGTVGMERDYSWSFVMIHFNLFCVHVEFQATENPTRTENNPKRLLRWDRAARLQDNGAVTWAASGFLDTEKD